MPRYLLEKAANFNDIERVILNDEELIIDTTIHKKCGKAGEGISLEQINERIEKIDNNNELSCLSCNVKACAIAKRCTLYSLICAVNQLKKSFSLEILEYLVAILNSKHDLGFFNLSEYSSIAKLFCPQEGLDISVPAITCKQLDFIVSLSEKVMFTGISLYIYILNKSLSPFLVASFAVYLEAVGCDLKFLDEIIAINVDNRTLVNELSVLEKFFQKRNNTKGKGTPEMLENCLLLIEYKQNIKDLKFKIKDFFSGEFNPTLKASYWETKFLSNTWKSTGFNLQKITLTLSNLCSLLEIRTQELVGNYFGEEKQGELYEITKKADSIQLEGQISYTAKLKNCLAATLELKTWTQAEVGSSYCIILDRLFKDASDPKRQNKKKSGFKLGEGSIEVLEQVFYSQTLDDAIGPISTEITENESKKFSLELCKFKWWRLNLQAKITNIVNSISSETRRPKVAKGVKDTEPIQMCIKNKAFNFIKDTFRKHGAVEIDTPVFELKETLMGKYGEEGAKLIYDLKDQGGELLSLRYDLTVPFARYCATNNVTKIKRFHIGKVWRRDQPNFNKGRFREFHQCDIDLAGASGPMIADSEILSIANEVMVGLGLPNFLIKISDRRLLEAIIEVAGADLERFATICSSVDKLDKQPWSEVAQELIEEKGIAKIVVDKLGPIVQNKGKILFCFYSLLTIYQVLYQN